MPTPAHHPAATAALAALQDLLDAAHDNGVIDEYRPNLGLPDGFDLYSLCNGIVNDYQTDLTARRLAHGDTE